MKLLMLIALLSPTLCADTEYFSINGLSTTERHNYYQLHVDHENLNINLDCSSFLHGLNLISEDETRFFYLYEPECYDIRNIIQDNAHNNQKSCLELDFERHSWEVFTGNETCRSSL